MDISKPEDLLDNQSSDPLASKSQQHIIIPTIRVLFQANKGNFGKGQALPGHFGQPIAYGS